MALVTGIVVSIPELRDQPEIAGAWLLVAVNTILRTLWPLDPGATTRLGSALLLLDLGTHVTAVMLSGGWESPFVLTVAIDILLSGFGRGYWEAFQAMGLAVAALGTIGVALTPGEESGQSVSQVILVYTFTAVLAGYARSLFLEAEVRQEEAAGRLTRLTEANVLLADLHRLAQTLPLSLDLQETLTTAGARVRELFDVSAFSVLLLDPATGSWTVGLTEGVRLPAEMSEEDLPAPVRAAIAQETTILEIDLLTEIDAPPAGLSPEARSGLYSALVARDRVVGLAALEHVEPGRYGEDQADLASRLGQTLAIAIDNAILFSRLRALGSESERSRIARQLHDRVGQGFAYVAMELDRIRAGPNGSPDLARLADDTRDLLREVREILHQLRADVDEKTDLATVTAAHLERFRTRTGIAAGLHSPPDNRRLPIGVERELWRILQEALLNVERHSRAKQVDVTWEIDRGAARLEIRDDGEGFDPATYSNSAGMLVMRERANAIGARLTVATGPGEGTIITVETEAP